MIPDMEPVLITDPELADILAELSSLEPVFHRPEPSVTIADLEKMTVDDFWEIGASGRRYSKSYVLDVLKKRQVSQQIDAWETRDFYCRRLAPDLYLLTYTLLQNKERLTRRSSIWQWVDEGWKAVFHQGTVVESA
jgi:hypothetical protein